MKKKLIIILIITLFTSCINDEVIDVKQNEQYKEFVLKSFNNEVSSLTFNIINKADNIILYIDEHEIKYNDTILLNDVRLNEKKDTLILNGKLINDVHIIYEGLMYISLKKYKTNNIILYDGCPWYTKDGYVILRSITFNVSVDEWFEENINI